MNLRTTSFIFAVIALSSTISREARSTSLGFASQDVSLSLSDTEIDGRRAPFTAAGVNPDVDSSPCLQKALRALRSSSPSGYRTYQIVQDKTIFEAFLLCDWNDLDVSTAVHETNHLLRSERDAYHLVSGELLSVPSTPNYPQPQLVAETVKKTLGLGNDDTVFNTYLNPQSPEQASSKTEFSYQLDELNAYTQDATAKVDLRDNLYDPAVSTDGLPALMTFVSFYAAMARSEYPPVWSHLSRDPKMKLTINKLWTQAEAALGRECRLTPQEQRADSFFRYVRYLCTTSQDSQSAMAQILGRNVVCAVDCHR